MCSVLMTGCNRERAEPSKPESHQQTLLVGLVPEQSIFEQVRRYEPLANYLSRRLDMQVKLVIMPSYANALNSFTEKKMDAAFFGSMTYVFAHARFGVEVLARPVALDGTSTYHGVIFVRKDSSIQSVLEMKGKRFAMVDQNTMAGYLFPLAYFRKWRTNYKTYLKEVYFAGTHEDAIYDVLERKADAGAAKSTVLKRLAEEDERIRNELLVLASTPEVPENSLAVRRGLSAPLKEKIKTVLLTMHEDPEGAKILRDFQALRFIETTDDDFKSVYAFARDLDIDVYSGDGPPSP